jgi:hypothetical protein
MYDLVNPVGQALALLSVVVKHTSHKHHSQHTRDLTNLLVTIIMVCTDALMYWLFLTSLLSLHRTTNSAMMLSCTHMPWMYWPPWPKPCLLWRYHSVTECDVKRCDVMWCDVMWSEVMWCDVMCSRVSRARLMPRLCTSDWSPPSHTMTLASSCLLSACCPRMCASLHPSIHQSVQSRFSHNSVTVVGCWWTMSWVERCFLWTTSTRLSACVFTGVMY